MTKNLDNMPLKDGVVLHRLYTSYLTFAKITLCSHLIFPLCLLS